MNLFYFCLDLPVSTYFDMTCYNIIHTSDILNRYLSLSRVYDVRRFV